jgi:hypothetical protein
MARFGQKQQSCDRDWEGVLGEERERESGRGRGSGRGSAGNGRGSRRETRREERDTSRLGNPERAVDGVPTSWR